MATIPQYQTRAAVGVGAARPVGMPAPIPATNYATPAPTGGTRFTDLRSSTLGYSPVAGPNYGQAQGYMNQASGAAGGIQVGNIPLPTQQKSIAAQNPDATYAALAAALKQAQTPEAAELRSMGMEQLRGLNTAPDRGQLAAQALQLQREMTQPAWEQDLRQVGQLNAAMGRIGSGMVTNQLMDVTAQRERDLSQFGRDAALQAAGMEMQDRLGRFGATTGYQGQLTGEDLARGGFTQGNALARFGVGEAVRGQNVDERNFQYGQGMDRAQFSLANQQASAQAAASRAGVYGGLGGQAASMANSSADFRAGQAARAAAMQAQQQGFQADQAQQAIQNRVQQQAMQEQLLNGAFNRQLAGAQAAGGFGYGNDPWGLQMAGAGQQQNLAAGGQQQLANQAAMAAMYGARL